MGITKVEVISACSPDNVEIDVKFQLATSSPDINLYQLFAGHSLAARDKCAYSSGM